jgi:hypothetical protein
LRVEAIADPPTIEGMPMTAGWSAASVVADDGWVCGVPVTGGASTRDEQIAAVTLERTHRALWPRPLAVGRRVGRAGLVAPAGSGATV